MLLQKKISTVLLVGFIFLSFISNAFAGSADPVAMLESTTTKLLQVIKTNRAALKSNPKLLRSYVNKIVLPIVDINNMARFAMGRDGWNKASDAQHKEFIEQFINLIVNTYSSALTAYSDQKVTYEPLRGGYQGVQRIQVNSKIIQSSGQTIPVSYRLVNHNGSWLVYDFSVEGVSMIQSFRSQFSSILNQPNGVVALLTTLQKHNAKVR